MGTRGRAIIDLEVEKVIELLNKAFADEWLAYYQYWIGAQVIKGYMKGSVIVELNEHAQDELRHAQMLSDRIIQLGGSKYINNTGECAKNTLFFINKSHIFKCYCRYPTKCIDIQRKTYKKIYSHGFGTCQKSRCSCYISCRKCT